MDDNEKNVWNPESCAYFDFLYKCVWWSIIHRIILNSFLCNLMVHFTSKKNIAMPFLFSTWPHFLITQHSKTGMYSHWEKGAVIWDWMCDVRLKYLLLLHQNNTRRQSYHSRWKQKLVNELLISILALVSTQQLKLFLVCLCFPLSWAWNWGDATDQTLYYSVGTR